MENGEITESSISSAIKKSSVFEALTGSGALLREKRGRGYIYKVQKESVVRRYFKHNCPDYDEAKEEHTRQNNIRKYRNSKAKGRVATHAVFIRSAVDFTANGNQISGSRDTAIGYFLESLECEKVCFVENIDNFRYDVPLVESGWTLVYSVGRIGKPLANKIKALECRHFGDLDYVGLDEYRRIKEVIPVAQLHIPLNYYENTLKYGLDIKEGQKASPALLSLAKEDEKVREVISFIQEHHLVLEQEGYDGN